MSISQYLLHKLAKGHKRIARILVFCLHSAFREQ